MDIFFITLASALAGFVDAIVGGGGLILLPALFSAFPAAAPATLLGTNKSASVWGTLLASWQFSRRVPIRWRLVLPAAGATMLAAFAGAWWVTQVSPELLRRLLPVVLVAVLIYTLVNQQMGRAHTPRFEGAREALILAGIGMGVGFYDGFFGPGTGSFFVFFLVRVLGYDFLNASVFAKLLNLSSNIAALVLFTYKGHVWWHLALPMAVANMAGSFWGARMAIRHGAGFVRIMFLLVVSGLIAKTSYDAFVKF